MAAMDVLGDKPDERKGGGRVHRARGGAAEHEHEDDRDEMSRGGHKKRARGGSTFDTPPKSKENIHVYNAEGSPEVEESTNRKPSFKDGGHTEGHMARPRHDRHQRGGAARTPYSSASQLEPPKDDRAGRGYEGIGSGRS